MPPRPTKPPGKKTGKQVRAKPISLRDLYIKSCAEVRQNPNSGVLDFLSANPVSSSIECIDVSRNYLGDRGVLPLLAVVDRCQNLQEINLGENGLRNNAIRALCISAVKHPSLRCIDVSDNYISEGAAVHLQHLLEDNPRIRWLGIDNTKIDVEWRVKLRDLVRANAAAAASQEQDVSNQAT
ncbi:Leucine-rich repeat [Trypanosoma melophagium]|uniref:Leucine-rich repeat n=1 Tax=Trypanosoma melophagium TaxID=715481 RepID=UPI00351A3B4D|nr:Leucine-rich repeat [Trypanosoma melophagium]